MIAKRIVDVVAASAALMVSAPLLAAIAIAVKISSPGPVLFRQVRVGRGGQLFELLKFRSMRTDAEQTGPQLTVGKDERITPIGHLLRNTKLDELPQLWNVVRGDMSLVGPRPEVPRYVAHYPDATASEVLSVRPGITEMLSIDCRHEASLLAQASDPERFYIEELLPRKLEAQLRYVRNRSFAGDLRIILRTIQTLIVR